MAFVIGTALVLLGQSYVQYVGTGLLAVAVYQSFPVIRPLATLLVDRLPRLPSRSGD